jgi:tRNA1(Val) A37 N6-methylase TrmN6
MVLRRILPRHTVTTGDVFIDIGSGMGRALVVAATYPFQRVIGVELSDELSDISRQNIDRVSTRLRCKDITVVTADATEYEIPDDATVMFMHNPFQGAIFEAVTKNILNSYDRKPRNLRIVYVNPIEESTFLSTNRIRPVRRIRGYRPGRDWSRSNSATLYEVQPG